MPNRYDDTLAVKPATGAQALPNGSGYSPPSDRRGKATAKATPDDNGSEPLPPPMGARRIVSKDETEADSNTPAVKAVTGAQALPTGSGYSPLSERRGKATAKATPDDDGSEPLPPPMGARRIVSKDETEADHI